MSVSAGPIKLHSQLHLKQGDDANLNIPVHDHFNYPVDLSQANDVRIEVLVNNKVMQNYSLSDQTAQGYGVIQVDTTYNNVLQVKLQREQTKSWPVGALTAVVLIQYNDVSIPSGFRHDEETYIVGSISKGHLVKEALN